MAEYITSMGDRLDYVCWKHYGTERGGTVEMVLEANPHLADHGVTMPVGITIILPDLEQPVVAEEETIRLWD